MSDTPSSGRFLDIAVIGMSLRFPGAESVDEFWQNLCNGVESTTFFSDDQLAAAGTQPETLANPDFVKAHPILRNIEEFDAAFFGLKPREAEAMDPQQRLFLECAWEALEHAGYDAERIAGPGRRLRRPSLSSYFILHVLPVLHQIGTPGSVFGTVSTTRRTPSPTRVSYKLNLRGPSMTVQTACSTSLVASTSRARACSTGECDMALAGGVSVDVPPVRRLPLPGRRHPVAGRPLPRRSTRRRRAPCSATASASSCSSASPTRSPTATRSTRSSAASAVNNDGSQKVGYTAPSVEGQAEVIAAAHADRRASSPRRSATSRRTAPARRSATRSRSRR